MFLNDLEKAFVMYQSSKYINQQRRNKIIAYTKIKQFYTNIKT